MKHELCHLEKSLHVGKAAKHEARLQSHPRVRHVLLEEPGANSAVATGTLLWQARDVATSFELMGSRALGQSIRTPLVVCGVLALVFSCKRLGAPASIEASQAHDAGGPLASTLAITTNSQVDVEARAQRLVDPWNAAHNAGDALR